MRIKDIAVHLRERELPSGRIELLFDYCINGKRTRRTTGLFLESGKSRSVKANNEEVRIIALEKKKILEDQLNGRTQEQEFSYYTSFIDYFKRQRDKKTEKTKVSWDATLVHILKYERNKNITIGEITQSWVEGFLSFMKKSGLKGNSQVLYTTKLVACINAARKEGLIKNNPFKNVEKPKSEETDKTYLTMAEVKKMAENPKKSKTSAIRAFLFGCMTGLRYCDIKALKWENIVDVGNGKLALSFRQQKTGGKELFPLNETAVSQLGERKSNDTLVFERMPSVNYAESFLRKWAESAGVNKHITFHTSRHTFATLLLSKTHDLYLVSSLLGHKEIETTKVYAKLICEDKQDAVGKLDNIF